MPEGADVVGADHPPVPIGPGRDRMAVSLNSFPMSCLVFYFLPAVFYLQILGTGILVLIIKTCDCVVYSSTLDFPTKLSNLAKCDKVCTVCLFYFFEAR